jgi:hypothetical protein
VFGVRRRLAQLGTVPVNGDARSLGASQALFEPLGRQRVRTDQAPFEAEMALLRTALGEAEFGEARAEGRAMTLEQAVAYALDE